MVKLIGVIWFLSHCFGPLAMANRGSPLSQCLAKEEERLHLNKIKGPIVKLNREMLSLFTTDDRLLLKKKYLHQICHSQSEFAPSLNLVRVVLIHRKEAFDSTSQNSIQKGLRNTLLSHFSKKTGQLLLEYLSAIQGLTHKADCLTEKMRPLQNIYHKYKVLEEHLDTNQLMEVSEITQIFVQLKQLNKLMKSCRPPKPTADRKVK